MGDHLLLRSGDKLVLSTGRLLLRGASDPDPDGGGLIRLKSPTNEVNFDDPLNKGLVAWYPFKQKGGNVLRDVVGDNHGDLESSMTSDDWVASPETKSLALDFDGTSQHVDLRAVSEFGSDDFSIALWFKTTSSQPLSVFSSYQSSNGRWIACEINGDLNGATDVGSVHFGIDDNTTKKTTSYFSSQAINDGEWHHAFLMRSKKWGQIRAYVDSIAVGAFSIAAGYGSVESTIPIRFGLSTVNTAPMQGRLSDFRIYDRALSDSEIHDLYQASRTGYVDQFKRRSIPFGVTSEPAGGFNHWYARQARTHRIVGSGVHV